MSEKNPSEIIEDFIALTEFSIEMYKKSREECDRLDSAERSKKWAHKFEFAKDKGERNKLATAYRLERLKRREYKDLVDKYKAINDFATSENNKPALKRMNGMLAVQKKQEKYLESDREYKAGDDNDSDRGQRSAGQKA